MLGAIRELRFALDIRARDAWREGDLVTFPPGTYWLRRFANVVVAQT